MTTIVINQPATTTQLAAILTGLANAYPNQPCTLNPATGELTVDAPPLETGAPTKPIDKATGRPDRPLRLRSVTPRPGKYACHDCDRTFDSAQGLGGHRGKTHARGERTGPLRTVGPRAGETHEAWEARLRGNACDAL